jgi:hypothetical protein
MVRWYSLRALWSVVTAPCLFLAGCGPSTGFYRSVDENTSRGEYLRAIQEVKENERAYGDKSTVLYKLDLGALYHYAGEADSSNRYLFAAEKEIEELYTESISLQVLSYILNDNVLPYDGEDFEKVFVNVFLALNYAGTGMNEDALVEARKVDLKLREFSRQYEGKNRYREDAFIRYFAGALYENEGEINDAFISYQKAFEAYRTYEIEYGTRAPSGLLDDLVRTAHLMSFEDEERRFRELGGAPFHRSPDGEGSIFVVAYAGKGPIKVEQRPTVTIPDSAGTLHTFQIALPSFESRHRVRRTYSLTIGNGSDTLSVTTERAEDISAIAAKSLEDRLALIYLKAGGRAIVKFLAAEKAKREIASDGDSKAGNFFASLAIDLVVAATEQADVRTWRTLPAEIQLARAFVRPGTYDLTIAASDGGYTGHRTVRVKPGLTTFVIADDLR